MIWLTWRQHRAEASVAAVVFAALATGLVVIGLRARHVAQQLGLPRCIRPGGACGSALEQMHQDFHWLPPFTATLVALPLLAGMFWAAPLIAREYEAGTHRLVWTQSVTRLRWLSSKLAVILSVATAAALALGMVTLWALDPLTPAFGTRFNSTWYDIQGVVPAVCMLFALAAGVAASALGRRTIPAMAATLVAYAAVRFPVHFLRHLWPAGTRTVTYPLTSLLRRPDLDSPLSIPGPNLSPSDWILKTTTFGPADRHFSPGVTVREALLRYCPDLPPRGGIGRGPLHACQAKIAGLSLRQVTEYQGAGHFWILQTVESLTFLILAGALITVSILAVVRRRSI